MGEHELLPAPEYGDPKDPRHLVVFYGTNCVGFDLFMAMQAAQQNFRRTCEGNNIQRITRLGVEVKARWEVQSWADANDVDEDCTKVIKVWAERVVKNTNEELQSSPSSDS